MVAKLLDTFNAGNTNLLFEVSNTIYQKYTHQSWNED